MPLRRSSSRPSAACRDAVQRQVSEAQLAQAKGQLAVADANLSRTVLVAPFRGRGS